MGARLHARITGRRPFSMPGGGTAAHILDQGGHVTRFPPWLRWLLLIAALVLAVIALLGAASILTGVAHWILPLAVVLLILAVAIPD
jgi:hypothetical protein